MNRLSMTRPAGPGPNDVNRANPSAFIGGFIFLGGTGAKERFQPLMNADERRWSPTVTLSGKSLANWLCRCLSIWVIPDGHS
jgi:hypothetical protein